MTQDIPQGDYGLVQVMAGQHTGRMGYYDDDAQDATEAIVYVSTPFQDGYVRMPRRWLGRLTLPPAELTQWKHDHPNLVKRFALSIP
jgi:hypothetical protein